MVTEPRAAGKRRTAEPGAEGGFSSETARGWMVHGLRQQIQETTAYLLKLREQLTMIESGRFGIDVRELVSSAPGKRQRPRAVEGAGAHAFKPESGRVSRNDPVRLGVQTAVLEGRLTSLHTGQPSRANPMRIPLSALESYKAERGI